MHQLKYINLLTGILCDIFNISRMIQLGPINLGDRNITREKDGTTGPIKPFLLRDYTLDANVLASLIAMHFRVIVPNLAQIVKAL